MVIRIHYPELQAEDVSDLFAAADAISVSPAPGATAGDAADGDDAAGSSASGVTHAMRRKKGKGAGAAAATRPFTAEVGERNNG